MSLIIVKDTTMKLYLDQVSRKKNYFSPRNRHLNLKKTEHTPKEELLRLMWTYNCPVSKAHRPKSKMIPIIAY